MLAIVMAVALAQCSFDTQCKGDRLCRNGQCVDGVPGDAPVAIPLTPASPLARAAQLGEEIGRRKQALEDVSIIAPSAMLASGILLLVLGIVGEVSLGQSNAQGLSCDDAGCWYGQYFGIPSLIAGTVLTLVGGINLPINIMRRVTLPDEIRDRENQIRELDQRQ